MRSRPTRAFTLIELLVVISIIAMLIAILLPALRTARDEARRVKCIGQVQQLMAASHNYAADSRGYFPHRGPGADWAWDLVGNDADLRDTFVEPYFDGRRDVMFCPSRLIEVRSTDSPQYRSQYAGPFVTYQYFNYQAGWRFARPDLTRVSTADPRLSLWGCMAVIKTGGSQAGQNLGHDLVGENRDPEGQSAGRIDGSARWVGFDQMEHYHGGGVSSYWPARP